MEINPKVMTEEEAFKNSIDALNSQLKGPKSLTNALENSLTNRKIGSMKDKMKEQQIINDLIEFIIEKYEDNGNYLTILNCEHIYNLAKDIEELKWDYLRLPRVK